MQRCHCKNSMIEDEIAKLNYISKTLNTDLGKQKEPEILQMNENICNKMQKAYQ